MTNEALVLDIIKTAAEAITYDTDKHAQYTTMQMWELEMRADEKMVTLPLILTDRPLYSVGNINDKRKDKAKTKALVYIFTGIVPLNEVIENKGPLADLANLLKTKLLTKIMEDSRVSPWAPIEYESEEILESTMNSHNPCGVWVRITIPTEQMLPC